MKRILFFLMVLFQALHSEEKVLIYTYSYNRPDFIEIQAKTFRKFLKDEYEFVVFNDARESEMQEKIRRTCAALEITCIDIPQSIHNRPYLQRARGDDYQAPSVRNCNVVQYSLNNYGFKHKGLIVLLDSDLFLVKDFSFKEYQGEAQIMAGCQVRRDVEYFWIGFVVMDFGKIPNKETLDFNLGEIKGNRVDSGGYTYYYVQQNPNVPIRYVDQIDVAGMRCSFCQKNEEQICTHNTEALKEARFDDHQIAFIQSAVHSSDFLADNHFLHYRSGSNWDCQSLEFHQKKTAVFNAYIDAIIAE